MWVSEKPGAECSYGVPALSRLPAHLKSPVIAPYLGAISGLPSTFNRCLVKSQPLLQGGLHLWAGGCGLWLQEGPGE